MTWGEPVDPVDVLSAAAQAAKLIRSSADPDATLAAAVRFLGSDPAGAAAAFPVRVAGLVEAAGERRAELFEHLNAWAGPLPGNRPFPAGIVPRVEPDSEAVRLAEYVNEAEDSARSMFPEGGAFSCFNIVDKSADGFFGGRSIVIRKGKRLPAEKVGKLRKGDQFATEPEGLPPSVRCLLDYPMDVPVLFTIETGAEPWALWDICCAIADEYARVYSRPDEVGVWGHDLDDLVIENLLYFPAERLIYPLIGS